MQDLSHGRNKRLVLHRPHIDNKFWSVSPASWARLCEKTKRFYTHAGYICETEAGMIAPEPCDMCSQLGQACKVYKDESLHPRVGLSCARCRVRARRLKKGGQCSFTEGDRGKA